MLAKVAIFEALYHDVEAPTRASAWSAGFDLKAYFSGADLTVYSTYGEKSFVNPTTYTPLFIAPGSVALIPTGFKIQLPKEFEAQIRPRSGLALKQKLVPINSPGTIDADFPGEWAVLLENRSKNVQLVNHGDRIAQAVIARYETLVFDEGRVEVITERAGGYGSTGK